MTKKPPKRPRPTFAALANKVRQEVTEEHEAWWAVERQVILESARREYEQAYNLLSKHTTSLELENAMLRENLRHAQDSWLKALGSRIRRMWS